MGTAIILVALAVIVFFAIKSSIKHTKGEGGCCGGGGDTIKEESVKLEHPVVATKVISIEGMHCDNCKNNVIRKLQQIEGVSASVDLKKKTATVQMDREIADDELTLAIERAGYTVVRVE